MTIEQAVERLETIRRWAEEIGDALDPKRTGTAKSDPRRAIVKAADQIATRASTALSIYRVTE